jgi:hypothetical protein
MEQQTPEKTLEQKLEELKNQVEPSETEPAQPVEPSAQPTEQVEKPAQDVYTEGEKAESKPTDYQPNYKFKVYDEEKEFDEWVRPYVTKDTEDKVRDLYTKAYGLDGVKSKLEKTREELANNEVRYGQLNTGLLEVQKMIESGDLENFFKVINVKDDAIYEYVRNRLAYEQADPEARQRHDQEAEMRRQNMLLQRQNELLNQQVVGGTYDYHARELEQTVSQPQVAEFAKRFDEKFGNGSFIDEVTQVGLYNYRKNGVDLTVPQAVDTVLKKYTAFEPQQQVAQMPQGNGIPQKIITKTITKNTIPNTGGDSNVSPTQKEITSLAEIEAIAAKFAKERRGR